MPVIVISSAFPPARRSRYGACGRGCDAACGRAMLSLCITALSQRSHSMRRNHDGEGAERLLQRASGGRSQAAALDTGLLPPRLK